MNKNIDRQFQKADAAIERAVADFMGKIDKMIGRRGRQRVVSQTRNRRNSRDVRFL